MSEAKAINDYIIAVLNSNNPFLLTRTGWGSEPVISAFVTGETPNASIKKLHYNILEYNAGIYRFNNDSIAKWGRMYAQAIRNSDICFTWMHDNVQNMIKIAQTALTKYTRTAPADYINPIVAANAGLTPWTRHLAGKRVLIISPFTNSISRQLNAKYQLFNGDKQLFDLNQEFCFYKAYNTLGGNFVHANWSDTFIKMIQDISSIKFDVALVSCGGYGLPICDFIRTKLDKSAIYLGGVLPLLFGVTNKRYDQDNNVEEYNPGLIRPEDDEKVVLNPFKLLYGIEIGNEVENGCYW